jgi:hypothetical protein
MVISDAWRVARRAPEAYVPQWYNRWYLYLLLVFGSGILANGPLFRFIKAHVVEAFKMPIGSMEPTLLVGDFFYVTPFRFVKRAVALGGDTVSMRRDSLFVSARFVPEPYVKLGAPHPRCRRGGRSCAGRASAAPSVGERFAARDCMRSHTMGRSGCRWPRIDWGWHRRDVHDERRCPARRDARGLLLRLIG